MSVVRGPLPEARLWLSMGFADETDLADYKFGRLRERRGHQLDAAEFCLWQRTTDTMDNLTRTHFLI